VAKLFDDLGAIVVNWEGDELGAFDAKGRKAQLLNRIEAGCLQVLREKLTEIQQDLIPRSQKSIGDDIRKLAATRS
jgi:hypothetical protein